MNSIEDISSLAELINLTDVSLHNNAITDVSALEEHVNLKKLDLSGNPLDDSAVEVLCTLTGLENWICREPVSHRKALQQSVPHCRRRMCLPEAGQQLFAAFTHR